MRAVGNSKPQKESAASGKPEAALFHDVQWKLTGQQPLEILLDALYELTRLLSTFISQFCPPLCFVHGTLFAGFDVNVHHVVLTNFHFDSLSVRFGKHDFHLAQRSRLAHQSSPYR
jgi:hypothetical protein